jgi:hypothetical protein
MLALAACKQQPYVQSRQHLQSLRAYALQAVQLEVCTTGMLANFNQALQSLVGSRDPCFAPASSH